MRLIALMSIALLALPGCAVPPPAANEARAKEATAERCPEALTGSRIPQCNRGDVKVITRDEIERTGALQGNPTPPQN